MDKNIENYLRVLQLFENENVNLSDLKPIINYIQILLDKSAVNAASNAAAANASNAEAAATTLITLKKTLIEAKATKATISLPTNFSNSNNYFGKPPATTFNSSTPFDKKLEYLEFLDRYVINEIIKKRVTFRGGRKKKQKGGGICPGFATELWNFSVDNPKIYAAISKEKLKEELTSNNIQEQYCMKRDEPKIKIPEKDNIFIMVFGLGTEKSKEVMTYTYADQKKDIVYFFDYDTNGIIKDAWDAYKDIKSIKKLEKPNIQKSISELKFNGSRLRMYKLSSLIKKCIINAKENQRVTIICVSHGTIITHGAILRTKIMGECDLSKLNVVCLSSPKMPPKNLVPNDKCVNVYFKKDTYLKVFKGFKYFDVPRIKDENINKDALYYYDDKTQCYIINNTNTFYALNMDNYLTDYTKSLKSPEVPLNLGKFLKHIIKKTDSVNYNHTNFEMMFPFIKYINIKFLNYYIYLIVTGDNKDTSVSFDEPFSS